MQPVSTAATVRRPVPSYDASPDEIESRPELDLHLQVGSLCGLTMQGLRLDVDPPDLTAVDVSDAVFVGCQFASPEIESELVRRGAIVVPTMAVPYPTQPPTLYTATDMADGFATGGFEGMYDARIYRHFLTHGGPLPDIREALAQRLHDHGIDDALADLLTTPFEVPVVGVMGGHAEPRGSLAYRAAVELGRALTAAGCLVVTGGGPGVMEAANLGAFLVDAASDAEVAEAVDLLATAPYFVDHDPYTARALELRAAASAGPAPSAPTTVADLRRGGLSIPTWLYGHEPANLFAAGIAKYFSNAIREDTILRLARGGIVFAPGRAGTVQEVFQAATKTFYATDGASGPFVFLGVDYWTATLPIEALLRPLLAASTAGDESTLIHLTDDPYEAVSIITG